MFFFDKMKAFLFLAFVTSTKNSMKPLDGGHFYAGTFKVFTDFFKKNGGTSFTN